MDSQPNKILALCKEYWRYLRLGVEGLSVLVWCLTVLLILIGLLSTAGFWFPALVKSLPALAKGFFTICLIIILLRFMYHAIVGRRFWLTFIFTIVARALSLVGIIIGSIMLLAPYASESGKHSEAYQKPPPPLIYLYDNPLLCLYVLGAGFGIGLLGELLVCITAIQKDQKAQLELQQKTLEAIQQSLHSVVILRNEGTTEISRERTEN